MRLFVRSWSTTAQRAHLWNTNTRIRPIVRPSGDAPTNTWTEKVAVWIRLSPAPPTRPTRLNNTNTQPTNRWMGKKTAHTHAGRDLIYTSVSLIQHAQTQQKDSLPSSETAKYLMSATIHSPASSSPKAATFDDSNEGGNGFDDRRFNMLTGFERDNNSPNPRSKSRDSSIIVLLVSEVFLSVEPNSEYISRAHAYCLWFTYFFTL